MADGFQVPEMPLGEVAFKAGAGAPEHNANVVEKFGTVAAATEKLTTSDITVPQVFVAVKVSWIVPVALLGTV